MGRVTEFMIGSTIGFILYVLVVSISQTLTSTLEFNDKIQKIFIIKFLSAICLLCLAFTSFSYQGKLENRTVKWGLILSSIALSANTMIVNWDILSNNTKIILIGACLSVVVWYAYHLESTSDKNKDNEDNEDDEDEEYEEYEEDDENEYNEYNYADKKNRVDINNGIYAKKRGMHHELDNRFDGEDARHMHDIYNGKIPAIDPQIFMRY